MTTPSHTGTIRTTSRTRAWYLSKFHGCSVRSVWREPQPFFGFILYTNRWVLKAADAGTAN